MNELGNHGFHKYFHVRGSLIESLTCCLRLGRSRDRRLIRRGAGGTGGAGGAGGAGGPWTSRAGEPGGELLTRLIRFRYDVMVYQLGSCDPGN